MTTPGEHKPKPDPIKTPDLEDMLNDMRTIARDILGSQTNSKWSEDPNSLSSSGQAVTSSIAYFIYERSIIGDIKVHRARSTEDERKQNLELKVDDYGLKLVRRDKKGRIISIGSRALRSYDEASKQYPELFPPEQASADPESD